MKTKKKSSLPKPAAVPAVVNTKPFGQVFLINKDGTLTPEPGIPDDEKPLLSKLSQEEMNKIVFANRSVIFGTETLGLTAKLGRALLLPFDAFLFDFSNPKEPRCFLLISAKDITRSMLTLINIRAYLEAIENRPVLIEKLKAHIQKNKTMQKILKPIVEGSTIEKMLEYVIRRRLSALFLTNEDDPETLKLFNSFVGSDSDLLDMIEVRKYMVGKNHVLSVLPSFVDLKQKHEAEVKVPKEKIIHTEEHHLAKSPETIQSIYTKLKVATFKINQNIFFNAKGKHYVSMKKESGGKNLAFFHFRKTSIYLVIMLEEKLVKKMVKHHEIKSLPESVQKFWNGKSTGLVISSTDYLKEIVDVLKMLIKK